MLLCLKKKEIERRGIGRAHHITVTGDHSHVFLCPTLLKRAIVSQCVHFIESPQATFYNIQQMSVECEWLPSGRSIPKEALGVPGIYWRLLSLHLYVVLTQISPGWTKPALYKNRPPFYTSKVWQS